MERCADCIHAKFSRGQCRGVMDCDPDESWCELGYDDIFCSDDIVELFDDYGDGYEDLDDFIDNFDCPGFSYRRDDDGPDPDAWYDERKIMSEDE